MNDVIYSTATELAAAIRQHHVSAMEVLEAHLAQIARHNAALNAIVTFDEQGARPRAQAADAALARNEIWGPLHGVPITLEDIHVTSGIRSTCGGYSPLAMHIPSEDSNVVAHQETQLHPFFRPCV